MSSQEQNPVPESRTLAPKPKKSEDELHSGGGLGRPEETTETRAVAPPSLGDEQARKRKENG